MKRSKTGSWSELCIVQYHYSLRTVCLGCLIGSIIRFSRKAGDENHHLHHPSEGAMWVVSLALVGAVISLGLVWTDILKKPASQKAKQLMSNKTQRALDYSAPFFFGFGIIAGGIGTKDIGWAVADGCSCLALVFSVWGIWAFVEALENCMSSGTPMGKPKATVTVETARARRTSSMPFTPSHPPRQTNGRYGAKPTNPLDFSSVFQ